MGFNSIGVLWHKSVDVIDYYYDVHQSPGLAFPLLSFSLSFQGLTEWVSPGWLAGYQVIEIHQYGIAVVVVLEIEIAFSRLWWMGCEWRIRSDWFELTYA